MAFENTIITKDDDEKYGLSKIYYKYNPYYETFINELGWTIDRNANCWLMPVYSFPDPDYDHASLAKGIWILYHKGEIIEVALDYIFDESKKLHRIWQLLELTPKTTNTLSKKDIVALLFKILKVYGYAGTWQKENYTMELQDLTNHAAK